MISYPLRSGKELFDDSETNNLSIPTYVYIHDIFPSHFILRDMMFTISEKFYFSQVFSFRGKKSILLYTVIFLILDFIGSSEN